MPVYKREKHRQTEMQPETAAEIQTERDGTGGARADLVESNASGLTSQQTKRT